VKKIFSWIYILLFTGCAGNWTQLTQPMTFEGTKEHFSNLKWKRKQKNDISASPSLKDPFEHIKLFKKDDSFIPHDYQCSLVQDVHTDSQENLTTNKTESDYALERLFIETNKLGGNTLKITEISLSKMFGKVYKCKPWRDGRR